MTTPRRPIYNNISMARLIMRLLSACVLLSAVHFDFPCACAADQDNRRPQSLLTLDGLFTRRDFDTQELPLLRWSERSSTYFVLEAASLGAGKDLVQHFPANGARKIVVPASAFAVHGGSSSLDVEAFEFSPDESKLLIYTNSKKVWRNNTRGDYWLLDVATLQLQKLGGDAPEASLMFAKFSPDGARVGYVRENNIYVQDLSDLSITAVTTDGSEILINGTSDWVNEEELSLRDCFRFSPDGQQILFWQFDTSNVRRFHLLNNTDALYPRIVSFPYPKVGETNSSTRLAVVSVAGGKVVWLQLPGNSRQHYLPHAEWLPDGSQIFVQQLNRLQNELRLFLADPSTGTTQVVMTEHDPAWLENENPVRWLKDGRSVLWLSERSGWRQAYQVNLSGEPIQPMTTGEFDIIDVSAVDTARGWLYYIASPENPTQRYLYRSPLAGGEPELVTPALQPGWHQYSLSPDAAWAVHTYSTFATPPIVEIVHLPDHKVVSVLADNRPLRNKLAALHRPSSEFFTIDIGGDVTLNAWCMKPPGFDASRQYPLLMYVYGEPYGQTVKDAWTGATRLWHEMLAQQGCIVASVDNRGTNAPLGRKWRKCVHRQIGILASQEQASAVRAMLQKWPFIDPTRVGVWGWSGGGSMSLNALFRYPDLYRSAIAVAPNADQLLYDTIYQERYMGLPEDNVVGYREGSPITHAHKLRGNLLLVHGTADDNGHYQGTERLMNELVAHGKHFTVLPYPNRTHSISEGSNTTRHFWGYLTKYLQDNLVSANAADSEAAVNSHPLEPQLQFINGSQQSIDIAWIKAPDERVPICSLEPGKHKIITTTIGHRFSLTGSADSSEAIITSEVPVQAFRFGGVPAFYTQHSSAEGYPVVASSNVNSYALAEAVYIVNLMLAKRPDVRTAMIKSGSRLCILAHNEFTTDLPEWAWLADEAVPGFENIAPRDYYAARARGMGGSETDPYCSCAEENLLGYAGDPYSTENILIHELAHNIHLRGMINIDATFDARVKLAYDAAMTEGLWKGKYASVNHHEYFAEGVQSWFDDNRENDHDHNHVNTRMELLNYDPRLAALCREVFGDTELRYTKPSTRLTDHLSGFDPSSAPKFEFPPRLNEVSKLIQAAAEQRGSETTVQ